MPMVTKSLALVAGGLLQRPSRELPRAEALEYLLSRATVSPLPGPGMEAALATLFGIAPDCAAQLPVAALTRLADRGLWEPADWLRADPVHLHADASRLMLFDHRVLDPKPDEVAALAATFRQTYAAEGYELETPVPARWYLRIHNLEAVRTTPTARVSGHSVEQAMPAGPGARRLWVLMNEIQMLFHEHPVNLAREQRGLPEINGLWIWGGGQSRLEGLHPPDSVYAAEPVTRGLARLAGVNPLPPPVDARGWLRQAGAGDHLIVFADAQPEALETSWSRFLVDAVRAGEVGRLTLVPDDGRRYDLDRRALARFWRRRKALADWSAVDA